MAGEKQIGWGVNTKLLSTISKQLDQLGKVIHAASGSPVSTTTTTTTVALYKIYSARLTQSGTNNPIAAEVFQDEIGDISFTRQSAGLYTVSSPSFIRGKVLLNNINPYAESSYPGPATNNSFEYAVNFGGGGNSLQVYLPVEYPKTGTSFKIQTFLVTTPADNVLSYYNLFIEIKIYN